MPRAGLTTQRVVDAAVELADREGVASLRLSRLAKELGVRTPSLYNHIDGAEDLEALLTVRALQELGRAITGAAVGRSGPDAVRRIAAAYRRFAHEHPGLYPFVVPTTAVDDQRIDAAGAALLEVVLAVFHSFGLGEHAVHAARTLRSTVHGFVSLEQAGGFGLSEDLDESFAWLVDTLVAGLAARTTGGGGAPGR